MQEFYVFEESTGVPHRIVYSDTMGTGLIIDQGNPIVELDPTAGCCFLGKSRENIEPETLAKMFGIIYQQPENYRKTGQAAATLIRESDLHVVPTLLKMVVEICTGKDPDLPWKLKVYEERTHDLYLSVDGFEDWHFAKTFASWYLVDLSDAQVSVDYNYKIEKH